MKSTIIMILAIAINVTGIFLPYFKGEYDHFAVGLSYIFQFAAFASLLLVPVGILWLLLDVIAGRNKKTARYPLYFRKAALAITMVIVMAGALGALASHNRFFAFFIVGGGICMFLCRSRRHGIFCLPLQMQPYFCIIVPVTVLAFRMAFFEEAKNKTTEYAISRSQLLIQDIEAFRDKNGYYPASLLSTIEDYQPGVSGILRFYYERNGEAYNLFFEQFSDKIGTQEIVMYNKLDEHEMTVHNRDLLQVSPENILRGYYKKVDLPHPHWKVFYFD